MTAKVKPKPIGDLKTPIATRAADAVIATRRARAHLAAQTPSEANALATIKLDQLTMQLARMVEAATRRKK